MSNPREEAAKVPSEQAIQRYGSLVMQRLVEPSKYGDLVYFADHTAIVAAQQQRIDALEKALRWIAYDSPSSAARAFARIAYAALEAK